ncbi:MULTISPECIES: PepSY domain-containing protein [Diaphorobacter]|uniref:Membrane protein YkoI n=1 Tax=Diaphorobacter nitroreducens TaxID=164759 RepID=A0AAX1WX99_9BURK|nr:MULTISPECIES: PepSY domain-containing protein [Diaphorobacter]ROR49194.1 putative membrane protein YkoI [Diaphorobacter nitroreducens]WKK88847.1 PepSY domain-containing protein [Diaphorobacter sp. C33]
MNALRRPFVLMALAVAAATAGPAAQAAERGHGDHDLARQALERGQVLPLRTVLEKVEREYQGQVLKVEFEHDDGRFIYEIRLLQQDGRMAKLKIDAVDGRVLQIKRKEH